MGKLIAYGAILWVATVLLPLFLTVDLFADIRMNKVFLSLRLFGLFPFVGGYMTMDKEGIYLHLSKKKAKCFLFSEMKEDKKGKIIAKAFLPLTVRSTVEIGYEDNPTALFLSGYLLQTLSAILYSVFARKMPYLNVRNGVILNEGRGGIKATVHAVTVFNLLTLSIALIKIILEEIVELLWQTKKKRMQSKI